MVLRAETNGGVGSMHSGLVLQPELSAQVNSPHMYYFSFYLPGLAIGAGARERQISVLERPRKP